MGEEGDEREADVGPYSAAISNELEVDAGWRWVGQLWE